VGRIQRDHTTERRGAGTTYRDRTKKRGLGYKERNPGEINTWGGKSESAKVWV